MDQSKPLDPTLKASGDSAPPPHQIHHPIINLLTYMGVFVFGQKTPPSQDGFLNRLKMLPTVNLYVGGGPHVLLLSINAIPWS